MPQLRDRRGDRARTAVAIEAQSSPGPDSSCPHQNATGCAVAFTCASNVNYEHSLGRLLPRDRRSSGRQLIDTSQVSTARPPSVDLEPGGKSERATRWMAGVTSHPGHRSRADGDDDQRRRCLRPPCRCGPVPYFLIRPRKLSISSWVSRVWRMTRAGGMGQVTIVADGRESGGPGPEPGAALAAASTVFRIDSL